MSSNLAYGWMASPKYFSFKRSAQGLKLISRCSLLTVPVPYAEFCNSHDLFMRLDCLMIAVKRIGARHDRGRHPLFSSLGQTSGTRRDDGSFAGTIESCAIMC